MTHATLPMTPEIWFRHLFKSKAALDGGTVRRKLRDMERMVGRQRFYQEIARRGYSVVENAGQVVIFCNAAPVVLTAGQMQTLIETLTLRFTPGVSRATSAALQWECFQHG